jgi:signal transduction histidine kinase
MQSTEPTVLLISPDATLCSAVRGALRSSKPSCHVAAVDDFAAARRSVADFSPDVIVVEESSLRSSPENLSQRQSRLQDVVAALAGFAPVVVLGSREAPASLSALIAAGAADFVAEAQTHLHDATACVERRLQTARRLSVDSACLDASEAPDGRNRDTFGEILRHELNNPLTGILGNAELLLAEARRHKTSPLSEGNLKRLETIAALAVRMRETVRRLSQACEARAEQVRSL